MAKTQLVTGTGPRHGDWMMFTLRFYTRSGLAAEDARAGILLLLAHARRVSSRQKFTFHL